MNFFSIPSLERKVKITALIDGLLLVLLIISLFILLGTKGCAKEPSDPGKENGTTADTLQGLPDNVTLPATADAGQSYQDSLIFVGDSLTAHLVNRGVLTGGQSTKQVWRTETNMLNLNASVTTQNIIYPKTGESLTIAEAAAKDKPSILIITLGTDWGLTLNENDFKSCYSDLVRAVKAASPDTTVVLQSIFPVTKSAKIKNEKVDQANGWVKAVAAENGCRYLDTQSVLKDANNCLKADYCISNDGIHLTKEAYEVILQYIRTHAVIK